MRRFVWLWVIVAFLVGLGLGGALFMWQRTSSLATRQQLLTRNAELKSRNTALETKVRSTEASLSVLQAQLDQASTPPVGMGSYTPSAASSTGPVTIVARSVDPTAAAAGKTMTLKVRVTGTPDKVRMRVVGPGGDWTYFLSRVGAVPSGGEEWSSDIKAPRTAGTYKFYAIAFQGTRKYTMPATAGYAFTVR